MTVYLCHKCQRTYESPVPVKNLSCNGRDGIIHNPQFMEEVEDSEGE